MDVASTQLLWALAAMLAGILALLTIILIVLVAVFRRTRQSIGPGATEPALFDHPSKRPQSRFGVPSTQPPPPTPARRSSRFVWLTGGVLAGTVAGLLISNSTTLKPAVTEATARITDLASPQPVEAPKPPAVVTQAKREERIVPPETGRSELGRLIEAFVGDLAQRLPIATGPDTALTTAEARNDSVALGYEVAESLSEKDEIELQENLEPDFRAEVCESVPEPGNMRDLIEHGATVRISYADQVGRTIAELTMAPGFCKGGS